LRGGIFFGTPLKKLQKIKKIDCDFSRIVKYKIGKGVSEMTDFSILKDDEMVRMYKVYGSNIETTFNRWMDIHNKRVKQQTLVDNLKKNYEREKVAIEAKENSNTQLKHIYLKNTKVENKISSYDSNAEGKIQYYNEQIKQNEERRDRDIQTIRDRYESKMNAEINSINARADKYHTYIDTQRKLLENKKDNTIRDLSANIIEPKIGDVLDEDAYPKLSKLKYDIQLEENKLPDLIKDEETWSKYQQYCSLRQQFVAQQEAQREADQLKREEERIREEAIRQRAIEKAEQNKKDEERWKRQSEERMAKEKADEQKKSWKENVYKKLTDEYKKYYNAVDKDTREQVMMLETVADVVNHFNTYKEALDKYIKFNNMDKDNEEAYNKYFKEENWNKYDVLSFKQRYEIANCNTKIEQLRLIKKYHSEIPKPEEEDDD